MTAVRPSCIILVGPPGSGKTAYAMNCKIHEPDVQVVSADDYFKQPDGTLDIDPKRIISDMTLAHKDCRARFRRIVGRKQTVIVDNFNATKDNRDYYVKYARRNGYNVMIVVMKFDPEEARARSAFRNMNPETFDKLVKSIDIEHGVYILPATSKDETPLLAAKFS